MVTAVEEKVHRNYLTLCELEFAPCSRTSVKAEQDNCDS